MPINWFNQNDIDTALSVLFVVYPQKSDEYYTEESEIVISKPEVIEYILNLEANNYCGNDVLCVAATIIRTVIKGHPLLDGNKRLGILLGESFLEQNGYRIRAGDNDFEKIALNLAKGIWDKDEVYRWLRKVSSVQPQQKQK
ncbi:MAG: death on curing protein [Thermotogaceae bacterium]|nr:death on curing protein [Thermotogaceae bacterium]